MYKMMLGNKKLLHCRDIVLLPGGDLGSLQVWCFGMWIKPDLKIQPGIKNKF